MDLEWKMHCFLVAAVVWSGIGVVVKVDEGGGWSVTVDAVVGDGLRAYAMPFAFDVANTTLDGGGQEVVVYDEGKFKTIEIAGALLSLGSVIGGADRWSYCGGRIVSGKRMARHCYTGDALIEGLECEGSVCSKGEEYLIDWEADAHLGPEGTVMNGDGSALFGAGARGDGWKRGDAITVSMRAAPEMRLEIIKGVGTLWSGHSVTDAAGSVVLSMVIVGALVNLTRSRRYGCAGCGDGFHSLEDLSEHANASHYRGGEDNNNDVLLGGVSGKAASEIPARSRVFDNSGVDTALRISAGVAAASLYAGVERAEGVFVSEDTLREGSVWLVTMSVGIVFAGAIFGRRRGGKSWPHVVYVVSEVLLLITLAYTLPKSYGESITVATLFIAGIVGSLLTGRAVRDIYGGSYTPVDGVCMGTTLCGLCVMIVGLMLLPMVAQTRGITSSSAWVIAVHLHGCTVALPLLVAGSGASD
mgnify:CR=1 FL=1